TGLRLNPVYEGRVAELYAADAGVEDAVWKIQHPLQAGYLPCSLGDTPRVYNITDINGRRLQISIEYAGEGDYRITSTAVTADGGNTAAIVSGTKVEAYVAGVGADYSGLLDNVITSLGGYTAKGTLSYPPENPPYPNYPPQDWPPVSVLENFYWSQVDDKIAYSSPLDINLAGNDMTLEAGYVNGPMTITNSDKNNVATLTLNGTLYIKGKAQIYGPTGNEPFSLTLDLNGQTIFVDDSTVGGGTALDIKFCNIRGPGVIIAVGDIYFAPKAETGTDAPIFVMSVLGSTQSNPNGDFYGAIAGNVTVTMQPGTNLTYPTGGFGGYNINFPTGAPEQLTYSIASWQVTPLSPNDFGD
ncbi:MAG: hypothetical protein OEV57_06705, partial [Dehalococcoidia bacterium]|nr:hypothetical protein [Dehalococcoidia bacterium]